MEVWGNDTKDWSLFPTSGDSTSSPLMQKYSHGSADERGAISEFDFDFASDHTTGSGGFSHRLFCGLDGRSRATVLLSRIGLRPRTVSAPSENSVELALVCWLASLVCLALGLFTQQAVIVNYLMTVLTFGAFQRDEYHGDHIYIVVNLLLVVTPVSACLSLDRWLEGRRNSLRGIKIERPCARQRLLLPLDCPAGNRGRLL